MKLTFPGNQFGMFTALLMWHSLLGRKILTTGNLRKRGIIIIDWYCMCKYDGSQLVILLFTVKLQENFVVLFCACSGCVG